LPLIRVACLKIELQGSGQGILKKFIKTGHFIPAWHNTLIGPHIEMGTLCGPTSVLQHSIIYPFLRYVHVYILSTVITLIYVLSTVITVISLHSRQGIASCRRRCSKQTPRGRHRHGTL
jgi:hypothetical protein